MGGATLAAEYPLLAGVPADRVYSIVKHWLEGFAVGFMGAKWVLWQSSASQVPGSLLESSLPVPHNQVSQALPLDSADCALQLKFGVGSPLLSTCPLCSCGGSQVPVRCLAVACQVHLQGRTCLLVILRSRLRGRGTSYGFPRGLKGLPVGNKSTPLQAPRQCKVGGDALGGVLVVCVSNCKHPKRVSNKKVANDLSL